MADTRERGKKPIDEWQQGSPEKGRVWDRLQKPKDNLSLKRPRLRSPRQDDARALRRHPNPVGTQYTPLKIHVGRIYAQIEDKKFLLRPQQIKAPPHRRDPKMNCEYHKDHAHDTDDSRLSKADIEKLIKRCQLHERKYARRAVYALGSSATTHDLGKISFSDRELVGLKLPHDDRLVVSPTISNFVVVRMLVDTGSSADILYLRAYDKLGLDRKYLKSIGFPNGHCVSILHGRGYSRPLLQWPDKKTPAHSSTSDRLSSTSQRSSQRLGE
ncbi:hypothetical protein LIER_06479 [Lithospermum erythrorhizon]|uniref:Uncharacterized protein n=1 Tax=Lithospermum erythrorhizon TaxID=34254 RepID=A0AAV3P901_LITER